MYDLLSDYDELVEIYLQTREDCPTLVFQVSFSDQWVLNFV